MMHLREYTWGPYLPQRGGVVQIRLCCVINGFEKKKPQACWLSPNTSEGFRNPSYVSFRRFFLCFFFFFFLFALLMCFSAGLCLQLSLSSGRGLGGSISRRPGLLPLAGTPTAACYCQPPSPSGAHTITPSGWGLFRQDKWAAGPSHWCPWV